MTKKKIPLNISWWLELKILNDNSCTFKYSKINNIYIINLNYQYYYYYYLINKKNLNSLNFYVVDSTSIKNKINQTYLTIYQSIFYDFKILLQTNFKQKIISISTIYKNSTWIERELKESLNIQYTNLIDSRKLLYNYNYNNNLQYNNFNNIINDLNI